MGATSPRSKVQVAPSEHILQLFDSVDSLGEAVGCFFADALSRGERVLCIAKPAHVEAAADTLARRDYTFASLVDSNRLVVLDAATILRLITKRGGPDVTALKTVVENTVDQLAPDGQRLSVYGELVELLAEEGNFQGAEQVEQFWNEFGASHPISLLCGYSSAHFVMPGALSALTSICAAHGELLQSRRDLLANWLLSRCAAPSAAAQ